MIRQLEYYTDTTKIQELDEGAAQQLYDKAMETALAFADVGSLPPNEAAANLQKAHEYAVAAEEFAYAYYRQNDRKLEGAADPVEDFDIEYTPPWAPKAVLTDAELRSKVLDYLRRRYPQTLPLEMRI